MAELVDAHDSKSCAFGRAGSIPALGTIEAVLKDSLYFVLKNQKFIAMFYVYVQVSKSRNYIYVGMTDNLERRTRLSQQWI